MPPCTYFIFANIAYFSPKGKALLLAHTFIVRQIISKCQTKFTQTRFERTDSCVERGDMLASTVTFFSTIAWFSTLF
jgi:hypothetical protein